MYSNGLKKLMMVFMCFLVVFSLIPSGISSATEHDISEYLELEKKLEQEETSQDVDEPYTHVQGGLEEWVEMSEGDAVDRERTDKVDQDVQEAFESEDDVSVIVHIEDGESEDFLDDAQAINHRAERIQTIIDQLTVRAETTQTEVLSVLDNLASQGEASEVASLWIINAISVRVSEAALAEIKQLTDVSHVTKEETFTVPEVEVETEPRLPEWGLEKVYAPDVWETYGIEGDGVVVGIMDTGVEGDHEALHENYRGSANNHDYSWADFSSNGYADPQDGHGHGTHVAGTAVGGNDGEPIGVAPGAEWIAVKIFNDSGSATETGIHQAFQWFLAPGGDPEMAPDVVNNSWGNANTYATTFLEGVRAWEAAGIFPLFSAGNEGPGGGTIGSPASFPESFAIGATNQLDQIADFSSRGPVVWDGESYIKPEVSAPGAQIYSAWPGGGYHTISGTSMAAPHVAGVIALMIEANRDMTIQDIRNVLKDTARAETHMGSLPNVIYGEGIANAYQAVTIAGYAGTVEGTLTDSDGNAIPGSIEVEQEQIHVDTNEDGTFSFSIREGSHVGLARAFGYETSEFSFEVTRGETVELNVTLNETAQTDLLGLIVDEDGEGVPAARIRVQDAPLSAVWTDDNGAFTIRGLPLGVYTLSVSGQGIVNTTYEVDVAATDEVTITVQRSETSEQPYWQTRNQNVERNAVADAHVDPSFLDLAWESSAPGRTIFSSPVANEDTIVYTTDAGYVHAVDRDREETRWSYRTQSLNRSTPTIAGDYVYVTGGQNQRLYRIHLDTGVVDWEIVLDNVPIYESPLYHDGVLYLTSNISGNTTVVAIQAEDGSELWRAEVQGDTYFGAAIAEEQLVVGSYSGRAIYALSLEDGSENWHVQTGSQEGFAATPAVKDGTIYAFSTNFSANGTLYAIEANSGTVLWEVDGMGDTQAAGPVVAGSVVIASSATVGGVRGFDTDTGEMIWENREVGTTVNNGAMDGSGTFYLSDNTNTLTAIDSANGESLGQWGIGAASSSAPAILDGNLFMTTHDALLSFVSPGMLTGVIADESGEAFQGTVRVVGTDQVVTADEQGEFLLEVLPGEHEVRVGAYGYEQVIETLEFRSGHIYEQEYSLAPVGDGRFIGTVTDERTGEPISGVEFSLQDTEMDWTTNESGRFELEDIAAGTYTVTAKAGGYEDFQSEVTIVEGQRKRVDWQMAPFDIAVLNDYESAITDLITQQGYRAEEREWDGFVDDIERYEVVYLNGAYGSGGWQPSDEEVRDLIDKANAEDVDLVFADTWGPSYGSIQHLVEYYGDPDSHQSNYGSTSLTLEVQQAHPILQGLAPGDRLPFASSANASWFNGYSGIHLGDIESGLIGTAGTGVAYKPVSEESAHVLLSTFTAASWNQPQQHWLHGQHEVLLATLDYLLDEETRFGELRVTIVDTNGDPLQARTTVRETGLQTTADRDGEAVLHHEEGEFTVEVRHSGYEIETVDVDFVYGEAVVIEVEMGESDGSQIIGDVVNAQTNTPLEGATLQLRDEGGEVIQETTSDGEGSYVFTELTEGEYQLTSQLESFVHFETTVTVASSSVEQQIFMEPVPSVAIIGDRAIGNDHLQAIFEEVNIDAERYSSTADILETVGDYDVVWFNNETNVSASDFAAFEEAAIARETSVVYGDTYFSGGGISHLHNHRDHPGERTRVDHRQTAAEYVVEDEHPIFANETGNIGLLTPTASRVTAFNEYDGFSLAQVAHVGEAPHGTGVAFTPTSPESVELLMSAHAVEIAKSGDDYTASGKDMFIDATLWAAYEQFYEVAGTVTNENGEAIRADVTVSIDDATLADRTAEDDASFTIPSIAGEANVRVEAFGYATEEIEVSINEDLEMLDIVLQTAEDAGSIQGSVNQLFEYGAIANVEVSLRPTDRTTVTNAEGSFRFDAVEPGSYTVCLYKEGLLREEVDVDVAPNENVQLEIGMRSSPTVGIIVDRSSGTGPNLSSYLQYQGYETEDFLYTDTEMIEEVDLVFANSDFNNQLIPSEEEFIRFTEALDASRTPVIWTGQHGGRGSIRYLVDYMNDPEIEYRGNVAGENTALVTANDHPIFENVDETFTFTNQSNYYYGFDGYSGNILAEQTKEGVDNIGSMVGMKGRTAESIEILLAGMTINTHFYPGHENYDDNRAQIIDNAILYAIDTEESYAGEIQGTLMNNFGTPVQGIIHIEETGDEVETRDNGEFFVALPEGTYTLHFSAFGHRDVTYEQSIQNGDIIEQVFELEADQSGQLIGEVLGAGEPLEGVVVDVINSGVTTSTGEDGTFAVTLPEGNYDIRFSKEGFQPVTDQVTIIEGEETSVQINLSGAEDVALFASPVNHDRLGPLLAEEGYDVSEYTRDQVEQLTEQAGEYEVIIMNEAPAPASEQAFQQLIQAADDAETSLVFLSQFGASPINALRDYTGNPGNTSQGFVANTVRFEVAEEHPIFAGFDEGEQIDVLHNASGNQQYAVFNDYDGQVIASSVGSEQQELGSSIGYEFRSSNHVHLLMAGLASSTYGHPNHRWTEDAKTIFINGIQWASQSASSEIVGVVTDEDGERLEGATVRIDTLDRQTVTNEEGEYQLSVAAGDYTIRAERDGYEYEEKQVTVASNSESVEVNFTLQSLPVMQVSGVVTDGTTGDSLQEVSVVLDNGETRSTETNAGGEYVFEGLVAGSYTVEFHKEGYMNVVREITLEDGNDETVNVELSAYDVAVVGDYRGELSTFLQQQDIAAVSVQADREFNVEAFELVIVNEAPDASQLQQIIDRTDAANVSLVLLDTWGNSGTFQALSEIFDGFHRDEQGYGEGAVSIQTEDHPIFASFADEQIEILAEGSPYATFAGYEGTASGQVVVGDTERGTGFGYEYRSKFHVHVLLSMFAVNNMTGPERGWTTDGKDLFLEAVNWAKEAEMDEVPLPNAPVWKETSGEYRERSIIVEGTADPNTRIEIYAGEERLEAVYSDEHGVFSTRLTLAPGEYVLHAEAVNESGSVRSDDEMVITVLPAIELPDPRPSDQDDAA